MASDETIPPSSPDGKQPDVENTKPVVSQRVQSTGNKWTDISLAMKRLSLNDFNHIGEVPCMRDSLLRGIAAGLGVGVIRGLRVGAFSASNWAMGTFFIISVGSWQICQSSLKREREQVRVVVEEMAQRRLRKVDPEQEKTQQKP